MTDIAELLSEPDKNELFRKLRAHGVILEEVYKRAGGPGQADTIISIVRQWSCIPRDPAFRMGLLDPILDRAGVQDDIRRKQVYLGARCMEKMLRGENYE